MPPGKNAELLYKCEDSSFISKQFLCDGIKDCSKDEDEDPYKACQNLTPPAQLCDEVRNLQLSFHSQICPNLSTHGMSISSSVQMQTIW